MSVSAAVIRHKIFACRQLLYLQTDLVYNARGRYGITYTQSYTSNVSLQGLYVRISKKGELRKCRLRSRMQIVACNMSGRLTSYEYYFIHTNRRIGAQTNLRKALYTRYAIKTCHFIFNYNSGVSKVDC